MSAATTAKQAAYGLEIWVQPGIPEDRELVFNVHFRNAEGTEWEVSASASASASANACVVWCSVSVSACVV
jgi:hypothetical protein